MKIKLLTLSALVVGTASYAEHAPTVSGYVQAVTSYQDTDRNGDKGDIGFSVPEAAVILQHDIAGLGAFVDLPFSFSSNSHAVSMDFSSSGQAYVHNASEGGFAWKLGQWDTPFGYEGANAPERVFLTNGTVSGYLPSVHRGLSLAYNAGDMGVEWLVANPTTFLTNKAANTNVAEVETGLNLNAKFDNIGLGVGGLYGRAHQKNHWAIFTKLMYDATAWNTALEVDYLKDHDVVQYRGGAKLLTAWHFNYHVSDPMTFGLRAEFVRHGVASTWASSIGPQYEVEKDVVLKADYTISGAINDFATGAAGETRVHTHTLALGAVAKF